ncbi:MAG: EF-hand domain-containing protein [archaeon]|nr:EF-hand domain-containing protein [archaeon]
MDISTGTPPDMAAAGGYYYPASPGMVLGMHSEMMPSVYPQMHQIPSAFSGSDDAFMCVMPAQTPHGGGYPSSPVPISPSEVSQFNPYSVSPFHPQPHSPADFTQQHHAAFSAPPLASPPLASPPLASSPMQHQHYQPSFAAGAGHPLPPSPHPFDHQPHYPVFTSTPPASPCLFDHQQQPSIPTQPPQHTVFTPPSSLSSPRPFVPQHLQAPLTPPQQSTQPALTQSQTKPPAHSAAIMSKHRLPSFAAPAPPPPGSQSDGNDEWRAAFLLFDKNKDGKLSSSEVVDLCRMSGKGYSPAAVREATQRIDADRDGMLNLSEFLAMVATLTVSSSTAPASHDELADAFKMFDVNGDGKISPEELVQAFQRLGEPASLSDALVMIKEVDTDGDGHVNFAEFKRLMRGADQD